MVGIEFIFEQLDLGPAGPSGRDYMYITSDHFLPANSPEIVGTANPGRIVVPDASAVVEFTTRNDGIGGLGFRVRWRAL